MSLQDKTISGFFWSFLQQVGGRGISFLITILLARMLTPADFGLIAMITVFIQISQTLVNGGFSLALIQKKDVDNEDYSSVFYINLIVSCVSYLVIYIAAPFVADFYEQPVLVLLIRVLATVFIINAFSYVQEAFLSKSLRFKSLMLVHIPSNIIGGIVSVAMAVLGFGVWSIVGMQLASRFSYAVQIWYYSKWRPLLSFNKTKAKGLFFFGYKLMLSDIFNALYNNIFVVIIGKFFNINIVGYYQTAYTMVDAPSSTISGVLQNVTFPVFSSIQDDLVKLKIGYKRVMKLSFFLIAPVFVFAGILAVPLFRFFFTEKWLPAVPYFQWLCIGGIFGPLIVCNLNIVNVIGRSDLFLKLELIRKVITIVAIVIVIPYGITALLLTQALSILFTYILFSSVAGRFIKYNFLEQLKDILPTILLCVTAGVTIIFVDNSLKVFSDIVRLIVSFFIGSILYGLVAKYLKFSQFVDLQNLFLEKILKRISVKNN
ncbi:MAG: lipopolysaccharide biosynthesis protein [Ginsengibacter sp.]